MPDFFRRTGLLPGTAYVIASNASAAAIRQARILKARYGDLIQICDGVADNVEIQAAIDALTAARTWHEMVKCFGSFILAADVNVPSYTRIDLTEACFSGAVFMPSSNSMVVTNAGRGSVNLLPNTQWQVSTGLGPGTQYNHEGTGTELPVDVSEYTLDSNLVSNYSFEIGDPPTGWTLWGAGAVGVRSNEQAKIGTYSAKVTRNGADCGFSFITIDPVPYRGKVLTFKCWVYATVANRADIYIEDSGGFTPSADHSGVAGWELLTVTRTVDAAATFLYIVTHVHTGDTSAYFDGALTYDGSSNLLTFLTTNTQRLKVGDIVAFSAAADAVLKVTSLEVEEVTVNTSFKARPPRGAIITLSAACTATPRMIADLIGENGNAMDGWGKTIVAYVWRDMHPQNRKVGSLYQLGFKKTAAGSQILYCNVEDWQKYTGRDVVFGVWVKHKIKGGIGTWRIFIGDGTGTESFSPYTTSADYTWIELTRLVSAEATTLYVAIDFAGASGDVYYVSQPMFAFGSYLGQGNYQQMPNEVLSPFQNYTPLSWSAASITFPKAIDVDGLYGFYFNPYAETDGRIAPTVKGFWMLFEGTSDTAGEAFAFKSKLALPLKYLAVMSVDVNNKVAYSNFFVELSSHRAYLYTNISGADWTLVSFDIGFYKLS